MIIQVQLNSHSNSKDPDTKTRIIRVEGTSPERHPNHPIWYRCWGYRWDHNKYEWLPYLQQFIFSSWKAIDDPMANH